MYERFTDHIKGVSSNIRLQRSILKHGITSFNFVIYYYHEDPAVILTDVETKVIQSFPFEELFNFKKEADSMLGYKHTAEAIEKFKSPQAVPERFFVKYFSKNIWKKTTFNFYFYSCLNFLWKLRLK